MFKKKLVAIGLLTSLCLGMTACGTDNHSNTTISNEPVISSETSEVAETISDIASEMVDEIIEATEAIEENIEIEGEETSEIEEETSVEIIDVETDEYINKIFDEVKETLGEDYYPQESLTPEYLETLYGITPEMYQSFYGEIPMISVNVDFLVGVKANDDYVDIVSEKLNNYIEGLKNDSFQYPKNAAVLPASTVITKGNYVFAIGTFGNTTNVMEEGEDALLEYATNNVNKVIEIINDID